MTARETEIRKGRFEFDIGNMLLKKSRPSGNAAHLIVPKSTIGKTLIIIIPRRQSDIGRLEFIKDSEKMKGNYRVNPDIQCNKCGMPLLRPAWDKKEELMLCQCIRKNICKKCGKPKEIAIPPWERSRMKESDFCQCKLTLKEIRKMK